MNEKERERNNIKVKERKKRLSIEEKRMNEKDRIWKVK